MTVQIYKSGIFTCFSATLFQIVSCTNYYAKTKTKTCRSVNIFFFLFIIETILENVCVYVLHELQGNMCQRCARWQDISVW